MKRPKGPLLTAAPPEARESRSPREGQSPPGGVYGGDGTILRPESVGFGQKIGWLQRRGELAPGEEIASLQFPRSEMRSISAETGGGGGLPGELAPPATSLSKGSACAHAPSVRLSPAHTPPDATKPLPAIDPPALPLTNSYNLRRPQGPLSKFSQKTPIPY